MALRRLSHLQGVKSLFRSPQTDNLVAMVRFDELLHYFCMFICFLGEWNARLQREHDTCGVWNTTFKAVGFKGHIASQWQNDIFIYGAYKFPHNILRVHSARYTQCIHISSCKLKLSKDIHVKVQTAPTHAPTHSHPKGQLYMTVRYPNVEIYTEMYTCVPMHAYLRRQGGGGA